MRTFVRFIPSMQHYVSLKVDLKMNKSNNLLDIISNFSYSPYDCIFSRIDDTKTFRKTINHHSIYLIWISYFMRFLMSMSSSMGN